jgi:hypothetical protein
MGAFDSSRNHQRPSDEIRCDRRDLPVGSDPADRLRGCKAIAGWDDALSELLVQPRLTDDAATFKLRCGTTEITDDPATGLPIFRCHGRLSLTDLKGDDLGSTTFQFELPDPDVTPLVSVTVPLTAAGRTRLRAGTVVVVEAHAVSVNGWHYPVAGYRTFMRSARVAH